MEECHTRNLERMQNLDSIVRNIYSIATGLVNKGMEVTRGFGKLVYAPNIQQQQILRKCGSFVRPTSTLKASKSPGGKGPSNAASFAAVAAKKKRS